MLYHIRVFYHLLCTNRCYPLFKSYIHSYTTYCTNTLVQFGARWSRSWYFWVQCSGVATTNESHIDGQFDLSESNRQVVINERSRLNLDSRGNRGGQGGRGRGHGGHRRRGNQYSSIKKLSKANAKYKRKLPPFRRKLQMTMALPWIFLRMIKATIRETVSAVKLPKYKK